MSDDLKAKLNALAAAEKAKQNNEQEEHRKYKETVAREYPRVCSELLDRVRKLLDGVDNLAISSQTIKQELTQVYGSTATGMKQEVIATVEVPVFTIAFLERRISFTPAGTNFLGIHGKIEVSTNHRNNPFDDGIVMIRSKDPQKWTLALVNKADVRNRYLELTDEVLRDVLGRALM